MIKLLGLILVLALSSTATAQTAPNPVVEHFRAYRAALAQGDLAAADAAASAALAASEARDGDGGRTAILALNLASLRLERGDHAGARHPAQRAHDLATARSDANVDPALAQLVLARAEVASGGGRARLRRTITDNAARQDLAAELYLAAAELARADFAERDFADAAQSWATAATHAHAAPSAPNLARARALILEGVAHLYRSNDLARTRVTENDERAHARFVEAGRLLQTEIVFAPGRRVNDAGRAAAEARAWDSALRMRLEGLGAAPTWTDAVPLPLGNPRGCGWRRTGDVPMPQFPSTAAEELRVGAVVAVVYIDANGEVAGREIIASAPAGRQFVDAFADVLQHWRFERTDNTASCEPTQVHATTMHFGQEELRFGSDYLPPARLPRDQREAPTRPRDEPQF